MIQCIIFPSLRFSPNAVSQQTLDTAQQPNNLSQLTHDTLHRPGERVCKVKGYLRMLIS